MVTTNKWGEPAVTWAAVGFRGRRPPSSGPIYFCTCLGCCTAASRCFPRSGWASAPCRQSPRSREYLRATVEQFRGEILQDPGGEGEEVGTDPRQWSPARRGRTCGTAAGARRWSVAASCFQAAAAGHPEPDRHWNQLLRTKHHTYTPFDFRIYITILANAILMLTKLEYDCKNEL